MNDVIITKTNGGLGRTNPAGDMISGLITQGVVVVAGAQLDTVYRLKGIKDAITLGLDENYDTANKVLVYEHINEYFRINPDGDLYLMIVSQNLSVTDMVNPSLSTYAKKLLIEAQGKVKQLGVSFNPTQIITDFSNVTAAIPLAQALADQEYTSHRPVSIILEGAGFDYSAGFNFRNQNSKSVSVMVGQSLSIANKVIGGTKYYEKYAAIGTVLGAISKASVNENIAWVEKFNLYGGSLLSAGISNTPIVSIPDGVLDTLNDNGTIFFRNHIGRAGIYFNDSPTCISLTDDFSFIENNRTIDKAVRAIREILLPRLNSPVLIDQATGKLSPEIVKSYEADGRRALETMLKSEEISSMDVFVDPNQNILSSSELQVQFSLVPTGTARKISVTIGFTNPF